MKTALKFIIPLILAGLLTWYQFRNIDLPKMVEDLSQADHKWVLITIAISLTAHLSRGFRWGLLIKPLGFKTKTYNTFISVMVGYFGNILAPRFGEFLRCVALNKLEKVPMNAALGSVVAERAFDFLCLLTLVGFSLLMEFDRFSLLLEGIMTDKARGMPATSILLIAAIVLVVISILGYIFRNKILSIKIFRKIFDFLKDIIIEAITSFRKMENKTAFIFHTFVIWILYYFMTYLMFFALPATAHLGPMSGLVILIIGGLGMSAPVTGGFGAFHNMVAGALVLFYGISETAGLNYAVSIHESQFVSIALVGGICSLITLLASKKQKPGVDENLR